jgi:NADH:ubiquinone oxidoreductase subunit 3 (subunit A)
LFYKSNQKLNWDYVTIFECGLDTGTSNRFSLNSRFFFFLLMFLVFDMELVLILQIPRNLGSTVVYWGLSLILVFLVFTTMEEWRRGRFN